MSSTGRKKTQSKMIQGADARQVAFSKRRTGIFKKASELCTLCSVETALVIFSPGGKAFTFGHPGVDTIINRLANDENPDSGAIQRCQADHEATLHKLNKQYSDLLEQLESEKKRGEKLKQMRAEHTGKCWVDTPVDDLNLKELEPMKVMLKDLKGNLLKRIEDASVQTSTSTSTSAANAAGGVDPHVTNPAEGSSSVDLHGHGVGRED